MATEIRIYHRLWNYDFAVLLFENIDGKRCIGREVAFEPSAEGAHEPNPTFSLTMEQAQRLIDDLWHAGLRPVAGKQSEGVTAAQARHLEDMRSIAFAKLNIEKGV